MNDNTLWAVFWVSIAVIMLTALVGMVVDTWITETNQTKREASKNGNNQSV